MTNKKIYYIHWHIESVIGSSVMAKYYKEKYREEIMKELIKPYHFYDDRIKQFPMINLN